MHDKLTRMENFIYYYIKYNYKDWTLKHATAQGAFAGVTLRE